MNLNGMHFNPSNDGRVAYKISQNPRLLAFGDDAELTRLTDAYRAAMKAGIAAGALPVPTTDVASEIRAALLAGEPVDPAEVMERLAESAAAEAHRQRTATLFRDIAHGLHSDVVHLLRLTAEDAWTGLAEQLDEILDRAEPVFASLDGALTADAALDADKVDDYRAARKLTDEYADLRAAHQALLATQEPALSEHALLFAWFEGLADVAPEAVRFTPVNPRNVIMQPTGGPARSIPHDVAAVDHLAWVVANRDALRPRIGTVDEANASAAAAFAAAAEGAPQGPKPEGGRLREQYGSEVNVIAVAPYFR